jgi:TonB family protein
MPVPQRQVMTLVAAVLAILAFGLGYVEIQRRRAENEAANDRRVATPRITAAAAVPTPEPIPSPAWTATPETMSAVFEFPVTTATPVAAVEAATPAARPLDLRSIDPKDVVAPQLIRRVEPAYPEAARRARIEGVVVIEAVVTDRGEVQEARVARGHNPLLDAAALAAVRQWAYEPARVKGSPVRVYVTVTVTFSLKR